MTAELELAAAMAVVTALIVFEISSRVTAAPSERAEAQLPQRGSAAAVAEFPAGVVAAATTDSADSKIEGTVYPEFYYQLTIQQRRNWRNRNWNKM